MVASKREVTSASFLSVRRGQVEQRVLGDGVCRAGIRAGAAGNAGRVDEAAVEAGGDAGVEAAAGGGQRERALHLVAGAHAAPARDAQLVLQRQVGVAAVVGGAALLALPARLADAEEARHRGQLGVLAGRLGQLGEHQLDRRGGDPARGRLARCRPSCRRGRAWCRRPAAPARPRRDHADAAGAERRHPVVEAERRHVADRLPGPPRGWSRRARPPRPGRRSRPSCAPTPRVVLAALLRAAHVRIVVGSGRRRPRRAPRRSGRSGCGSAPACRRRARTASPARASRAAPRAGRGRGRRAGRPSRTRAGARSGRGSTCRSSRARRTRAGGAPARACRCGRRRRGCRRGRPCSPRRPARRSRTACRASSPAGCRPAGRRSAPP